MEQDAAGGERRNRQLQGAILAAIGIASIGCRSVVTVEDDGSTGSVASGAGGGAGEGEPLQPNTSLGDVIDSAVCEGARPIIEADGTESGYAQCPDGTLHRYDASVACQDTVTPCMGTEPGYRRCHLDADCPGSSRCASFGTECSCIRDPCEVDTDCKAGEACVCAGVGTNKLHAVCAATNCADGTACASGECGLFAYRSTCGVYSFALACRTEDDVCRLNADCEPRQCNLSDGVLEWRCGAAPGELCSVEGRPLMIDATPRTAPAVPRDDWLASLELATVALDGELRAALARHWQRIAGYEHASVASFARFSLQLMALGAPPQLLVEAQAAAADEIEHAKIAYALASAYAGAPVGPGPIDLADLQVTTSVRDVVLDLVREACVGETLNAAEARECAALVGDPKLSALHLRIAEDEQRHALLAWRTLAWLLEDHQELRRDVAEAFAVAAAARTSPGPRTRSAPEHGLLDEGQRHAIRRRVLHDVVLPCARALTAICRSTEAAPWFFRSSSGAG